MGLTKKNRLRRTSLAFHHFLCENVNKLKDVLKEIAKLKLFTIFFVKM